MTLQAQEAIRSAQATFDSLRRGNSGPTRQSCRRAIEHTRELAEKVDASTNQGRNLRLRIAMLEEKFAKWQEDMDRLYEAPRLASADDSWKNK